jgi:tetratricopeptide (TPR) repeat protein
MPGTVNHIDDFTLLRHVAKDLSEFEERKTQRHLSSCGICQRNFEKIEELDYVLREAGPELLGEAEWEDLPSGDPFRRRPEPHPLKKPEGAPRGMALANECIAAAKEASGKKDSLLSRRDAGEDALRGALGQLRLSELTDRYILGYALEDAVSRMVEGPARWLRFAKAATARLSEEPIAHRSSSLAEYAYPHSHLMGRAHLLAGIARNWTGEYEKGGRDLQAAYGAFTKGAVTDLELARVELAEATRRSFVDRGEEGLILAARAMRTFVDFGMEDEVARAEAVKGVVLSNGGRREEAISAFRTALLTFERLGLWNAYVSTLQNIAGSLIHLGRLEEARREYARALRKVSRTGQPAIHAFIRQNLARTLFEAGEHAQAAPAFGSAASLFEQQGAMADALVALLFQIECHARAGAGARAGSLMAAFRQRVEELGALDTSTIKELEAALSGRNPDLTSLARLRDEVEETLRGHLQGVAG